MPTGVQRTNKRDYANFMQRMAEHLIATDYEFLGLLDVQTGYLTVFGKNKDIDGMACDGSYYDDEMPRVFRKLLPEEYLEEGLRAMARAHVIEALNHHDCYVCSFPARSFGKTRAGRMQWKFSYLDASRTQLLITRTDITDVFTAEHDPLTGLNNRQAFYHRVREMLDANPDRKFVMLRCDMDRFKAYNDTYGTHAGDRLLAELGRAIRNRAWPALSIFSRISGDHFCAIIPADDLDAEALAAEYAHWLERMVGGYRLTSSIGVYAITEPRIEISLMCDRALLALRTVKNRYDRKLAWYDDALRRQLMQEQALMDDTIAALREEQFVIYFQPQINYTDGSLVGAEALVRWQHPRHGLMMPGDFIPLFEKNGFILKLDQYVWEHTCRHLRRWLDHTDGELHTPVSVNISRYDIYDPNLCRTLCDLVEKYRLPTQLLRLEITESAYMENPQQLIDVVRELQSKGFTVEMDDFGAGYSSLNTLKDVPVDILKLDVHFLSDCEDGTRGGTILYSIIRMAHWLHLPVIAEGVETAAQADYLKSLSCFYMQGYRFGKPMPAEEYEVLVLRGQADEMILPTVEATDAEALWDPAGQASLIFNRFVGSAAILEYCNGSAEIIRANDQFYQELGTTREAYLDKQRHTLDRFQGKHRAAYLAMLEQAMLTGTEASCEVQSLPQTEGEAPIWTSNRVQLLTHVHDRALLYLSVENITARKALESQLLDVLGRPATAGSELPMASNTLSNQELRIMEEQSGLMVCRYYMKRRILERLYRDPGSRDGHTVLKENIPADVVERGIVSPETAADYTAFFQQMIDGVPRGNADVQILIDSKEYRWYHGSYALVYSQSGEPLYALVTFFDNTNEHNMQLASEKWQVSLSLALSDALLYTEINLNKNTVEQLSGHLDGADSVRTFEDVVRWGRHGRLENAEACEYNAFMDRQRLLGLFEEGVVEDHFDYCLHKAGGEKALLRVSVGMTRYSHSQDVIAFVTFTALAGREQELELLSKKAFQDALTGALNREGFNRRTEELMRDYEPSHCTALFMIDLDNFKQVNDRLGHQVGDLVLRQVADALRSAFRATDAVGRIGGDEFMVLLTGSFTAAFLEKKAAELLQCMQMSVGSRRQIAISVSIGVAYGWGRTSFEKLYRISDQALYSAKKAGKCRYSMFNADTNATQTQCSDGLQTLQTLLDHADGQLPGSRMPYEALIENMPGDVMIITVEKDIRVTHCNGWLLRTLGYTRQEVEDLQRGNPMVLVHPEDAQSLLELLTQLARSEDSGSLTYRLLAKDGTYRHVLLRACVTERSAVGAILHGVHTDVEDLIRAQTAPQ